MALLCLIKPSRIKTILLRRFGLVPQERIYHFDAIKTGFAVADSLRTQGSTFEMIVDKSAVGDFEAIFEDFGNPTHARGSVRRAYANRK